MITAPSREHQNGAVYVRVQWLRKALARKSRRRTPNITSKHIKSLLRRSAARAASAAATRAFGANIRTKRSRPAAEHSAAPMTAAPAAPPYHQKPGHCRRREIPSLLELSKCSRHHRHHDTKAPARHKRKQSLQPYGGLYARRHMAGATTEARWQ